MAKGKLLLPFSIGSGARRPEKVDGLLPPDLLAERPLLAGQPDARQQEEAGRQAEEHEEAALGERVRGGLQGN